jgi:hypothetical protein
VLYIFAGNAAARLDDHITALNYYTASLNSRRTYSRGLLGRGRAIFNLAIVRANATDTPFDEAYQLPPDTACIDSFGDLNTAAVERLLEQAQLCYEEAENSPDQPLGADLDVKIPFERGELLQWRSGNGYGDYWVEAEQNLLQAITNYEGAEAEKQARLRVQAGLAHGFLGHLTLNTTGDAEAAVEHFRTAVDILRFEANQESVDESITAYRAKIEALEAELKMTADAPP